MLDVRQETQYRQAILAAYLHVKLQYSQKDCARFLKISPSTVSRLLAFAEDKGIFAVKKIFQSNIDLGTQKFLDEIVDISEINDRLWAIAEQNSAPSRIRNINLIDAEGDPHSFGYFLDFCEKSARAISGSLEGSRLIGVAWGQTLYFTGRNLVFSSDGGVAPTVIPVCPNLSVGNVQFSASHIAELISQRAHRSEEISFGTSIAVSAFIPRVYLEGEDEAQLFIEKMLDSSENYVRVFGGFNRTEVGLIQSADTLLTGIGAANRPLGKNIHEFLKFSAGRGAAFDEDDIKRCVFSDISGNFLPKKKLKKSDQMIFEQMSRLWTGVKLSEIESISVRADQEPYSERGRRGVIAIGHGAEKAPTLLEYIKRGLVNEAYIDRHLLAELKKLLR